MAILASGAFGAVFWTGVDRPLGALALLPLMWASIPSLRIRFAAILAYALIALWPVAASVEGFFPDAFWGAGVLTWFLFGLAWTAPFCLLSPLGGRRRRFLTSLAVLVASVVPPWGVMSWCHPVLSAGWLMPGGGAVAMAFLVLLWAWGCSSNSLGLKAGLATVITLVGALQASRVQEIIEAAPVGLLAVDTRAQVPGTIGDLVRHVGNLAEHTEKVQSRGDLVVFPETTVANWRPSTDAAVDMLLGPSARRGALLLGTIFNDEGEGRSGGAMIVEGLQKVRHYARQPLPLSLWRPWDPDLHHQAHWQAPGVRTIGGMPIAIRICSEEMTPFWSALDSLHEPKPVAAVGLVNSWWMNSRVQVESQRSHARAGAALLGVPLVRAINWPTPQGHS